MARTPQSDRIIADYLTRKVAHRYTSEAGTFRIISEPKMVERIDHFTQNMGRVLGMLDDIPADHTRDVCDSALGLAYSVTWEGAERW